MPDERTTNDQFLHAQTDPFDPIKALAPADRLDEVATAPAASRLADATHKRFLSAAQGGQDDLVFKYGQQFVDENLAGPADLSIIAQSYLSVRDCINARIWAQKAIAAFRLAGRDADEPLRRISACCPADHDKPRIAWNPVQRVRIEQLLDKAEAAKSDSGEAFVRLGELFYGFGDYELAIVSLQRGLNKGRIAHPDEAYVYLGLSEQNVGDLEAARSAFARLKTVAGISRRVLRLWTLFAETQLSASGQRTMTDNGSCPGNGEGGS